MKPEIIKKSIKSKDQGPQDTLLNKHPPLLPPRYTFEGTEMDIRGLINVWYASYKTGSRNHLLLIVWCPSYYTVLCSRGRKECTASKDVLRTLRSFQSKYLSV